MSLPRIFVLCPDYDAPSGGVRRLYRHVDVLRRRGLRAWLVHQRPGFRCSWFPNATAVTTLDRHPPLPSDFLVVPEIYGAAVGDLAPGVPKVIFNQNAYLTFRDFPVTCGPTPAPYLRPDVVAVLAVSEDNAAYLRYAFPGVVVHRLHYGIDPVFAPRWPKRRAVAFMPRKNAGDIAQVMNILRYRGTLAGWDLVPIDGLSEADVAKRLAECAVFLSFGTVEGCPLPPLEAMASGCVVVGYHGRGGREYFDPAFSSPVEAGDIIGFAQAAEAMLTREAASPGTLEQLGRAAEAYVRTHYSPEREESDIIDTWRTIIETRPPEPKPS